jgi:ATP-dependent Clp protease ATP-binding subunit ClpA
VFERFTERARHVVVLAQDEARGLGHAYIGTEHLLLGLVREEEGLAARVLASLEITLVAARARVLEIVGRGEGMPSGQIPFRPKAKKTLELALSEALSLGHNYIGTEHVLLGLVRLNDGTGMAVLRDLGAEPETIRNEMIRLLSGPGTRETGAEPSVTGLHRLAADAAAVVTAARSEAREDGRLLVGSEHLLLGLAAVEGTRELLEVHGFRLGEARARARSLRAGPPSEAHERIFTAQASRVMAIAEQEASMAAHPAVEAVDILLAVLDELASPAARLLLGIGDQADALRRAALDREEG